jgi:hypothetical protein
LCAQIEQKLRIEAGADFAGEDKVVPFVITNQESAQACAFALRFGEAADHELLGQFAFHLQPVWRAALLVN